MPGLPGASEFGREYADEASLTNSTRFASILPTLWIEMYQRILKEHQVSCRLSAGP